VLFLATGVISYLLSAPLLVVVMSAAARQNLLLRLVGYLVLGFPSGFAVILRYMAAAKLYNSAVRAENAREGEGTDSPETAET
jgi:hypothetical protein